MKDSSMTVPISRATTITVRREVISSVPAVTTVRTSRAVTSRATTTASRVVTITSRAAI